ncbi:MAG: NHLP family bacteriocin export ABC transporter peptidase/permease/ATPase subunit [Clostridiaceae bacterium]|nr:NHLP family bacteriocin export ABC transporter peptidase/permease/ATPase subunit [Clostridiaceae bacterium]
MGRNVKVPVIMQMEALECGAACLAMVLAYFGKWIPLERVRSDCGVSRDGSSAKNILLAARNYGLKAKGYRMEPKALKDIELPAIIHWNFNHFVVFNGFKKDKALLNDPARGTVAVSIEEFDKSYTGIVLRFEKSESFTPEGKPRSVLDFAMQRLKGTLVPFVFVAVTGILTAVVNMAGPAFSRVFMDNILSGKSPDWFMPFIAVLGFTLLFQFAIALLESIYFLKIRGKLAITANSMFMWHVLRLPIEFFSQRFAGDIASRQQSNEGIAETLIKKLAPVLLNVLLIVFYFVVMLRYSVVLSCVGIAAVLLNMLAVYIVSEKRINLSRTLERDGGKLSGFTMGGIEMIESIKASGAENGFFERWAGYHAKYNNSYVTFSKAEQYLGAIPELLKQIANTAVLMIGAYLILDGKFTIGMLIAFQGFLGAFLSPVRQLTDVMQSFQQMQSQMECVDDVMNYKSDVEFSTEQYEDPQIESFQKLTGNIEIKGLTFGYNRLGPPLIEDFNISLKAGSRVALVGGSGSGKSTLAKLISGLYRQWSGEILFDGISREQICREIFTSSLTVVDQDIVLFQDTISANISMWDSAIPEVTVIEAAKDAQIHQDIMQREGGYSHIIKEGGNNFSGGQRQRFEIARALSQNPSIIILDEATSALDPKTEFSIMEAIKSRGITCIIIAHRLSTIRDCDEIVVLEKGRVVERGTHDEMMITGGKYAQLISTE